MKNWYLLYCQTQKFERVVMRISSFGIPCYFPLETRICARRDRNSKRIVEKPLFPGYLFVHFDPEIVHTTTITDIPGAHSFIRFGGMPCVVAPSVIEGFKCARLMRLDHQDSAVECANISSELITQISTIYEIQNSTARNVELIRLLESDSAQVELKQGKTRIYSAIPGRQSRLLDIQYPLSRL